MPTPDVMQATPVLRAMRERRSVRRYNDQPVERATIQTLLTAANWAPSAHNRQPWRFVVIETQAAKEQLARAMGDRLRADLQADGLPVEAIDQDVNRSYTRITSAPVLVLFCLSMQDMDAYPDDRRASKEYMLGVQSVALAAQNFMLAAHDAGLATCWLSAPLFCPDVVRAALDLPANCESQALLMLGYTDEQPEKTRQPVDELVMWR
jgi:coenzyme F420-0:L-glutamate ligase / coenzyme F420-1:gamma-L-glutamate ligase